MWMKLLSYIFKLAPHVVLAIQTLHGDQIANATKKKMAQDMLAETMSGAADVTSGQNSALAAIAGSIASIAIDQAVTITKASGAYQKATAIANAVNIAGQVAQTLSQSSASAPQTPVPAPVLTPASVTPAPSGATLFTPSTTGI